MGEVGGDGSERVVGIDRAPIFGWGAVVCVGEGGGGWAGGDGIDPLAFATVEVLRILAKQAQLALILGGGV